MGKVNLTNQTWTPLQSEGGLGAIIHGRQYEIWSR